MPPRPIYRWKSFWLGLFILAFLCWAWHSSYRRHSGMRWGNVKRSISISSGWSGVSIRKGKDLTGTGLPAGPGLRGFSTFSDELDVQRL